MKKIINFLKNNKMVLTVELLVVVIMLGSAGMMYRLTYEAELQKVMTMHYRMGRANEMAEGADRQVSDFVENIYARFMYDFDENNSNNKYYGYGVTWEIYDKNNNIIAQSTENDLMLLYFDEEYQEDGSSYMTVTKAYLVESYFTEEEMEGAWDFIYSVVDDEEFIYNDLVDTVTGYYDENDEFVPVEILLYDRNTREEYCLKNEESINKDGIEYTTMNGLHSSIFEEESEDEYTKNYFLIANLKKRNDSVNEAIKKAEVDKIKDGIFYSEIELPWYDAEYETTSDTKQSDADWIRFGLCADLNYMTLNNMLFRIYLIIDIVLCALVCVGIIHIVRKSDEKRKYLDSMKYTFINAMAHEMKTPSAVIVNSVECIKDGVKPEKQSKYLDKVKKEGLHMNRLLLDMLTYTKLTDEDRKIQKEEVNMKQLFEETIEHYTSAIEKRKIQVEWDVSSEKIIMADRKLMEMVVDNYLSNAVKYCTEAGIIKITMDEKGVVVFNSGEIIYPTKLKAIWEPLYVMDESRKNREGSSGMGLAISAKIMDLHNMEYGARNADDGVEFYINLA